MIQLEAAVTDLEKSPEIGVVVVKGQGGFFCSGADLSVASGEMAAPKEGIDMCEFMQNVTTRLHGLPCLSIAVVEGGALGGGTELSTACDFRIFTKGSKWRSVHVTMGLTPGWGGGARLVQLVGRTRALRLLCGAEMLTAEQAQAVGLADLVVDAAGEELEKKVDEFIAPFLSNPISSLRGCKAVVNAGASNNLRDALRLELTEFGQLWGAPANVEAVKKVLTKIHHEKTKA